MLTTKNGAPEKDRNASVGAAEVIGRVVQHGGSLLADHPCGQGEMPIALGAPGGAPGELLPSASGINLRPDLGDPTALREMQAYHIAAPRWGGCLNRVGRQKSAAG